MTTQAIMVDFPLFVLFPIVIDLISIFLAFMTFIIISFFQDPGKRFKLGILKILALIALYFVFFEGIILLIPMMLSLFTGEGYYYLLSGSEGFLGLPGTYNLPAAIYLFLSFALRDLGIIGIIFLLLAAVELLFLLGLVMRYQFKEKEDNYTTLILLLTVDMMWGPLLLVLFIFTMPGGPVGSLSIVSACIVAIVLMILSGSGSSEDLILQEKEQQIIEQQEKELQAKEQQEVIAVERRGLIAKIYKRYTEIELDRLARLLEFENTIDLERFLLSLPDDSPLMIEGNMVKIVRSEDKNVDDAIDELDQMFADWESKERAKRGKI